MDSRAGSFEAVAGSEQSPAALPGALRHRGGGRLQLTIYDSRQSALFKSSIVIRKSSIFGALHFAAACTYNPLYLTGSIELPMNTLAVYPGSFDPVTNGHIDLIKRSAALFDKVIIAILRNRDKTPLFTVEERTEMLDNVIRDLENVSVTSFDGLLVDFVEQLGASVIIRGIRAISDYEYELQMALMNRRLSSKVETVFMLPAESYSFLSSKLVKEISNLGGSIHGLVPEDVENRLRSKFRAK